MMDLSGAAWQHSGRRRTRRSFSVASSIGFSPWEVVFTGTEHEIAGKWITLDHYPPFLVRYWPKTSQNHKNFPTPGCMMTDWTTLDTCLLVSHKRHWTRVTVLFIVTEKHRKTQPTEASKRFREEVTVTSLFALPLGRLRSGMMDASFYGSF